ncbi:MAG TPA: MerR family transcriptional regulator [Candidatus Bathyarchaeia archaeon]|nr:MerR family transcriptional regulator [Candidatus Bathyarchaeia archaeon]
MVDNSGVDKAMKKNGYLVREFAKLTRVTVRTLHYYDQVGLLKPSFERPNGYRVYTDADLLKLQQIVTLKFMGFSLDEIKRLLDRRGYEAVKALKVQAEAVKDEIARLREASRAIDQVLIRLEKDGRIHKDKLIKIMEVIQMGEDVKKAWHEKFFTEEEMKQFQELGKKYTPEDMVAYQKRWEALIAEVKANLKLDPAGEKAQDLGRRWTALLDEVYGGQPALKTQIAKAYNAGAIPKEQNMIAPEVWDFIKKVHAAGGGKCK